ncbi:hypothetical protein FQR65_LT14719 [Abscondita terminalis]|nr:hypothetical protein FQR65_LT14719 [Abscondita terminalis]
MMDIRMQKAAEFLQIGEAISEVGQKVGIPPNLSHFAKTFKQVFHIEPRHVRIGIAGGYQMTISDRIGAEASLGVGYASMNHDVYKKEKNSGKLRSETYNYFGPNKFSISFVYKLFDLLIFLFILTTLAGCKKTGIPEEETKPGEQQVTLRLVLPQSGNKAGTYAISQVDQNSIHSLDVLAFRVAADGKEYYAYHKKAVLLRPNDNATTVDFHVDLLKSTDKFRFVLIANAAAQLQTALNGLPANAEKETLMSRIDIPTGTNKLAAQEYTAVTNTLAGEIFLFESPAAASTGDPNATGLVIAGKYAGVYDNVLV